MKMITKNIAKYGYMIFKDGKIINRWQYEETLLQELLESVFFLQLYITLELVPGFVTFNLSYNVVTNITSVSRE